MKNFLFTFTYILQANFVLPYHNYIYKLYKIRRPHPLDYKFIYISPANLGWLEGNNKLKALKQPISKTNRNGFKKLQNNLNSNEKEKCCQKCCYIKNTYNYLLKNVYSTANKVRSSLPSLG